MHGHQHSGRGQVIQDSTISCEARSGGSGDPSLRRERTLISKKGKPFTKRFRVSPFRNDYDLLEQDLALRTYWADLTKPNKPVSPHNKRINLLAVRRFLTRLGKPITTTALSELIEHKRNNPRDHALEQQLKLWKSEVTNATIQNDVAMILGIFHRNYARLDLTIHVEAHGNKTTPIKEPILRAIYQDEQLTEAQRDEISLMAYSGERRHAINSVPLENVHLVEGTQSALIDVPANVSKTATNHISIIPKELAERLLERAQKLGYEVLVPNYETLWNEITKLAKRKYNVVLKSHYMRKRAETIAEKIPSTDMNPNWWMTLFGNKPTLGHLPTIYSLMSNTEIIEAYETHLGPKLSLDGETIQPASKTLAQENKELKEQILQLTKLLTQSLQNKT